MNYRIWLRIQLQDNTWITMGENHLIEWDFRDLIAASSGWVIMNQASSDLAVALIPKLEKGIFELTEYTNLYTNYEISYGLGTIRDALKFYQNLLSDCQDHPYTQVYGSIIT